ncbi:hypothetical protein [Leptospira neocaledonica]|uniref:Uncharacterized protein n=1 Tax=Leptospira neocaledonica TaxID=2023192 RepID=A0A2M9ZW65_9LEPT|nr:hypothetical protein [Leptospira neocaledonica]PJZ76312.1 hypothetical protein CH365_13030 [Leptospira neocaledonica]
MILIKALVEIVKTKNMKLILVAYLLHSLINFLISNDPGAFASYSVIVELLSWRIAITLSTLLFVIYFILKTFYELAKYPSSNEQEVETFFDFSFRLIGFSLIFFLFSFATVFLINITFLRGEESIFNMKVVDSLFKRGIGFAYMLFLSIIIVTRQVRRLLQNFLQALKNENMRTKLWVWFSLDLFAFVIEYSPVISNGIVIWLEGTIILVFNIAMIVYFARKCGELLSLGEY